MAYIVRVGGTRRKETYPKLSSKSGVETNSGLPFFTCSDSRALSTGLKPVHKNPNRPWFCALLGSWQVFVEFCALDISYSQYHGE